MSTEDKNEENGRRDIVVAGEYVLGVLDAAAHREAEARIARDPAFAALVDSWRDDFTAFNDDYEEVTPPASAYGAIEGKLFPAAQETGSSGGLWASLVFWRGLAAASLVAVIALGALQAGLLTPQEPESTPLVANMTGEDSSINLVALYDDSRGTVRLTPVAATEPEPKSLELWLIVGEESPVSLGLVPQDGEGEIVIDEKLRNRFTDGAVLAITLEPAGGSPIDGPTGPLVVAGPARPL